MAKVAMLVGQDFEDVEFRRPFDELRRAGHEVTVLGRHAGEEIRGKRGKETTRADAAAGEQDPRDYDALVIPGGYGPDHLRMDEGVVAFVRRFVGTGRTVAAVCHGPQLLIEANVVRGKKMTSYRSVRTDLRNAGAEWQDREVVEDGQFITSRNPQDLDAFSKAILARLR